MDYSLGFMLIHVLHFTVATKQPAMTAATIATTVHQAENIKQTLNDQLADLARLTVNIMRTQMVAIFGNIIIAMPIGIVVAYAWQSSFGQSLLTPHKAEVMLQGLNPFTSLALPHAAIAGVCLFLSGLIAGYYDNLSVYHHVGARLRQHSLLIKMMSIERLDNISCYIENNLGALAGNFWFGVMLGSMGTLGEILGLPLDIRHIAFSSVYFAQSMYVLGSHVDIDTGIISFIGVLLIGLVNLLVSFSLALFVALKARNVTYGEWVALGKLIGGHFITRPSDFFLPPSNAGLVANEPIDEEHIKVSKK
jgi:site-specific recombinase